MRYYIIRLLRSSAKRLLPVCVGMGLLLSIALSAQAQIDTDQLMQSVQGTRWALLIGIANYPQSEGFQVQQLKAPVKDVNALAGFLRDPEKGGFDPEHIFTLTDEQATRRKILITFNDIAKRSAPEDMVIFYFSGHGVRQGDNGTTYLIPYDHDLRDVETTCIDFDDLAKKIRDMEASKVIVVLDACHSGGVKPEGARTAGNTGLADRYLKAFGTSEGRALLLSSDQTEVSWETEDSGIFTHFLLEGLNGAADANDDGIVTFTEASTYVEEAVPKHTREHFPRIQKPTRRYEFGQVRGYIPLAINRHKVNVQKQDTLMNKRNVAIFQASIADLDDAIKDFSLQMVKSARDKTLNDEPLTQQESLLIKEVDALRKGDITATDYGARARAIHNLGRADLRISVKPADAVVKLTPVNSPELAIPPSSPNVYKVDSGQYNLSVQRPGYRPSSRHITVGEVNSLVTVDLEKLMGTLRLRVNPADAEVTINPVNIAAPNTEASASRSVRIRPTGEDSTKSLPVGMYSIAARKEGYEHATKELVEIKADIPTTVTLKLIPVAPKSARILDAGLPADTRVLVDEIPVSLPYEASPGMHRIRLERNGFKPVEISRELAGAQVLSLNPVWVPSTGTLQIYVDPYDAIVTVTPLSIDESGTEIRMGRDFLIQPPGKRDVPAGTYRVTASKQGYEGVIREPVQIRANDIAELTLTLRSLVPPGGVTRPGRFVEPVGIRQPGGIPRVGAFAASMVVPGLGQHLQGRRGSGLLYEAAIVGVGAATIWTFIDYNKSLDDYEDIKIQIQTEAPKQTKFTAELSDLEAKQEDAHDTAKSKRIVAMAAQLGLGAIWFINAIDAGFAVPAQPVSGVVFEALPTSDGGQIMVRAPF